MIRPDLRKVVRDAHRPDVLAADGSRAPDPALDGRSILITGATGSFGNHFLRTILERYSPRRVVVFSRDELKQYEMQQREPFRSRSDVMRWFLGDVRDGARLTKAMEDVDVVIHAAALKHVTAAEYNPFEAVKTNVLGAQNVIDAALACGVQRVVALSTDKAAAPINLYGATKLVSDKLFVAANNHRGDRNVAFSVVRYGNVLGSRGSVIPFFLDRRESGVLPITDTRMTRFSISLQEGVDYVLLALAKAWGGEVFVPKIPSYRLVDVAEAIAPHARREIVGMRPGEKLHEEMITTTDALGTIEFSRYYVILPSTQLWDVERFRLESNGSIGQHCGDGFSYNSGENDHFLTVEELREQIFGATTPLVRGVATPVAATPVARSIVPVAPAAPRTDTETPIPYGRHEIDESDIAAVVDVLRGDWLTTGPMVERFESAFAQFTGAAHAVAVSNGTAALHLTMLAAGIGPGDEVIVPALTFAASANCVRYVGATVVFADVRPDTLTIDVEHVESLITPRTRAIIAVDFAGLPADLGPLAQLARRHSLLLVEDGCHAPGARYRGASVGSIAHCTTFSFHPVKHLTTGEGGMITTNDADTARRLRTLRNHGITSDQRQRHALGTWEYDMVTLGFNYRLPDVQCALGLSQLTRLPQWLERRQMLADRYTSELATLPGVQLQTVPADRTHAWHLFTLRLTGDDVSARRRVRFDTLRAQGIQANVHYRPVYQHSYYRDLGYPTGLCPVAEKAYEGLLSIPLWHGLTDADQQRVIDALQAHALAEV